MMTMQNIYIRNEKELQEKIATIKKDGPRNLHIIADFDNTLSYAYINGEKVQSMIAQIRKLGYLGGEYTKKAYALYDQYNPIEIDPNVPQEEKNEKMIEWWTAHIQIMSEYGLNKKILDDVVQNSTFTLRHGINDFFELLHKSNIPILLFSAGADYFITEYLKKNRIQYNNISIISNEYNFDSNGNILGYKNKIIHTFNKGEIAIKGNPKYNKILHRKNIILLGDSLGDLDMSKGVEHNTKITIGFYNQKEESNLQKYIDSYDVILCNDQSMDYINELLNKIL